MPYEVIGHAARMSISTGNGDGGETGLFGGQRVGKDSAVVAALGAVDEANCAIGWAHVAADEQLGAELERLQSEFFVLGAQLAGGSPVLGDSEVARVTAALHALEAELPALTSFILPGGSELAARIHWARAVVRRAERAVVAAGVQGTAVVYLNRVADLLFQMARAANGGDDREWHPA